MKRPKMNLPPIWEIQERSSRVFQSPHDSSANLPRCSKATRMKGSVTFLKLSTSDHYSRSGHLYGWHMKAPSANHLRAGAPPSPQRDFQRTSRRNGFLLMTHDLSMCAWHIHFQMTDDVDISHPGGHYTIFIDFHSCLTDSFLFLVASCP